MAQAEKTAQEFIQHSFSPLVAVLRSPQVDQVVGRNNLSFVELLQPYCSLKSEGQIRDPSGIQCPVKNWKLIIRDVHWTPPPPLDARKLLNHAVSSNYCDDTTSLEMGNFKIDIPVSTPWLNCWREKYVEVQFASEHEFTKHFVACMLVGSTSDEDVAETFKSLVQQLAQLQTVTPPRLPRWFNSNVLRSYVLIHDVSTGSKDKAERAFESLRQTYGSGNCFFLCINSKTLSEPDAEHVISDPWSLYISRRRDTSNNHNSYNDSLPRTPVDARTVADKAASVSSDIADVQDNFAVQPQGEASHPLSPVDEPETNFDSANLLSSTLSGSTESVGSNVNSSAWEATPARRGAALTTHDVENVQQFLNDFAFKALLPYFERQISALHEAVANRKGVSRSLLSATKRWFGTSKPGSGVTTNVNTVISYTAECPELQLRRLGDLWFMCGQWARAFDAYHTAKREFHADAAWLCYAGALEMAALSAFMADEPTRKTYTYMEESITTYANTCCMAPYAVRATILSAQCLCGRGLYGEAAKQLIRMTSEDSDLRSAVLLEQAALCFAAGGPAKRTLPPLPRKYAFHMVLAGNRYSKAGQKQHAYRCYKQAFQIYGTSGWRLAVDHVQFALGRLAGSLRLAADSVRWLSAPLAPLSPQPPLQQAALLREYTVAHQQWVESCSDRTTLPVLPLPLLLSQKTRVLCGGVAPLSSPARVAATGTSLASGDDPEEQKYWTKMEEMLLAQTHGNIPFVFKPSLTLYTDVTDNSVNPTVPQGEPVHISLQLENPLKIPLLLADIELLWRFETSDGESTDNERGDDARDARPVSARGVPTVALPPRATHALAVALTPLRAGVLRVLGVAFKLMNSIEGSSDPGTAIAGKLEFNIRGPRLSKNKDTPAPEYGVDKRLQIFITPNAPCLQMTFSELEPVVVSGELLTVDVELRNVGPVPLRNLHLCVSHPHCARVCSAQPHAFAQLHAQKYTRMPPNTEERVIRQQRWRTTCARHVTAVAGSGRVTLQLRPTAAARTLRLLAYYEGATDTAAAGALRPYRLLRHTFHFRVIESAKILAIPRRNIRLKGDTAFEALTLAVDVKNVSGGAEGSALSVEVLEASLLSRQWRLDGAVSPETAAVPLASHEKLHLVLQGSRLTSHAEQIVHSGIKINSSHPESAASTDQPPYCEFLTDFPLPWDEEFDARGQEDNKTEESIESSLVVRWKARTESGRHAVGQHYVWLDSFASGRAPDPPVSRLFSRDDNAAETGADKALQHTLIYRLEHCRAVSHNFTTRKLCLVPVTLHIVNCLPAPVTAFVDWSAASSQSGGVGWTGSVGGAGGVRVALGRYQAAAVRASAAVTAPGTYQLGRGLRVRGDAPLAPAAPPHASLLVVTQQR